MSTPVTITALSQQRGVSCWLSAGCWSPWTISSCSSCWISSPGGRPTCSTSRPPPAFRVRLRLTQQNVDPHGEIRHVRVDRAPSDMPVGPQQDETVLSGMVEARDGPIYVV
jgi:hypothetical protein